jgi:hypothetical protein
MPWYIYLIHFFAGAFLANAVPHFVHGVSGEKFQSPFASPPGKGLSSPVVNVLWGFANLIAGYVLLVLKGAPLPRDYLDLGAVALGILAIALHLSLHFGRVKGNNG